MKINVNHVLALYFLNSINVKRSVHWDFTKQIKEIVFPAHTSAQNAMVQALINALDVKYHYS